MWTLFCLKGFGAVGCEHRALLAKCTGWCRVGRQSTVTGFAGEREELWHWLWWEVEEE